MVKSQGLHWQGPNPKPTRCQQVLYTTDLHCLYYTSREIMAGSWNTGWNEKYFNEVHHEGLMWQENKKDNKTNPIWTSNMTSLISVSVKSVFLHLHLAPQS